MGGGPGPWGQERGQSKLRCLPPSSSHRQLSRSDVRRLSILEIGEGILFPSLPVFRAAWSSERNSTASPSSGTWKMSTQSSGKPPGIGALLREGLGAVDVSEAGGPER